MSTWGGGSTGAQGYPRMLHGKGRGGGGWNRVQAGRVCGQEAVKHSEVREVPETGRGSEGSGGSAVGPLSSLASDLQAGLALPSAILVNCFASVEASVTPLSGQDPQPAQPTLCLLREAPLVWAHGLAVSQPGDHWLGLPLHTDAHGNILAFSY